MGFLEGLLSGLSGKDNNKPTRLELDTKGRPDINKDGKSVIISYGRPRQKGKK